MYLINYLTQDVFFAYSPERVSSGSIFRDLYTYPTIVGGIDEASLVQAMAFYRSVLEAEISAIIVQAGHRVYEEFDFTRFPHCRVVLDGRRIIDHQHVEAAGMRYIAIGDGDDIALPQGSEQDVQRPVFQMGGHC